MWLSIESVADYVDRKGKQYVKCYGLFGLFVLIHWFI